MGEPRPMFARMNHHGRDMEEGAGAAQFRNRRRATAVASPARSGAAGIEVQAPVSIAGYIADFACIEAKLVIEVDGGQHAEQAALDAERTRKLQINGYRVLRFWDNDVLLRTDAVLEEILRHLNSHE